MPDQFMELLVRAAKDPEQQRLWMEQLQEGVAVLTDSTQEAWIMDLAQPCPNAFATMVRLASKYLIEELDIQDCEKPECPPPLPGFTSSTWEAVCVEALDIRRK